MKLEPKDLFNKDEKDFLKDIGSLTPKELMLKYDLVADGKPVSKREAKELIDTIRLLLLSRSKDNK